MTRDIRGGIFKAALLVCIGVALLGLGALLIDIARRGIGQIDAQLLTDGPSQRPSRAGARPAILSTAYLGILVLVIAVPLGVATAVYLEEYARKERWYNRWLELNIQNLAAVPSIIYGILGLAFLVRGLNLGRVLLAGGLILTLLVLPTIIIAAREAIRAVPDSIRQGAFALGATRGQVVARQVLPASIPGIATGTILAVSRAIGETAPLLLIGAATFVAVDPTLFSQFTALPVMIFNWTGQPQEEFKLLAAGAIIILLGILVLLNATAIWLRNKYQKRW